MTFWVIPGQDRLVSDTEWLTSRHSFSFGDHYDPSNTNHGVLLVNNDDVVSPLQGFDQHPHRESEIVTWVTSGSLVHQDSEGNSGIVYPGLAQRMSAGTGVLHSERNDTWEQLSTAGTTPTRFVQMWIMPDESGLAPSYAQHEVEAELVDGRLVAVASGDPTVDSAIRIANKSATLHAVRLTAGSTVSLPTARFSHAYVTRGSVDVGGHRLDEGDAVRGTDVGGEPITATADAELLIWSMGRDLRELMGG
ncbi:pirin family protein [Gordonia sp. CPCC 205515]|uniref:pirin family protein n=1 Tax=Gordonia sp. CPCC 205515 TaxID=3140791 RepID=UPI003AF36295